jgi:hypothetical protein
MKYETILIYVVVIFYFLGIDTVKDFLLSLRSSFLMKWRRLGRESVLVLFRPNFKIKFLV